MTYKEWMKATGSRFNLSDADVELILTNEHLNADDAVDVDKAKRALVKEFSMMIPMCNVSEGGYSISWNVEAMKLWYNQVCGELGIDPVGTMPKIRNKSNRW